MEQHTHQIAHLSLLYLACRAGTTELFYGAWSTKKLACFIMSCSTDGLVSHCESWHNWVILMGMQHNWVIVWYWEIGYSTTGYFIAAHNWVISHNCWVRVSHGGYSTTGLFHSSTQLGYFMQHTTGLFVMLGSSIPARWRPHNVVIK